MSFSPRQSPFKRPESPSVNTPNTVIGAPSTVSQLPTSPTKGTNASPNVSPKMTSDRQSPFIRRPSQLGGSSERVQSPFARGPSRLAVAETTESLPQPPPQINSTPTSSNPSLTDPFLVQPLTSTSPTKTTPLSSRPITSYNDFPSTSIQNSPVSKPSSKLCLQPAIGANSSTYKHISPSLLRLMRESFEVIDISSSNLLTINNLKPILEQLNLDANPSSLSSFFPQGQSQSGLSLAKYLDILSEPMKEISEKEELLAAFEAFDVDDSGQVDVGELKDAVVRAGMNEKDVQVILDEFSGRRAFGAKGITAKDFNSGSNGRQGVGRGDVFKYRDFVAGITGGGISADGLAA